MYIGVGAAKQSNLAQSLATGKTFIAKIAEINLAEIELGRLAEQNASNLAIKDFVQRMIQDHTQAETTCSNWQTARGQHWKAFVSTFHTRERQNLSASRRYT